MICPPPTGLQSLADDLFGERLPMATRYAEILRTRGAEQGLIGPREVDRIWERHLINCALMVRALGAPGAVTSLADVGSGAGLPGLVIAMARPDLEVTLIETMQRRVTFLTEVVEELELENVEAIRARAQELHGVRDFEVVTARAVAALDTLAQWTLPLVREGGQLIAMKGQNAALEVEKAEKTLRRLHGENPTVELIQGTGVEVPTTVVRVSVYSRPATKGAPRGK